MHSDTLRNNVEMANDEGADPASDIKKENPGAATTADIGEKGQIKKKPSPDAHQFANAPAEARVSGIPDSDPHKVDKMAKVAEPDIDHNVENPT